jgi:hypothetical protein
MIVGELAEEGKSVPADVWLTHDLSGFCSA